jgi:hypothetical protein
MVLRVEWQRGRRRLLSLQTAAFDFFRELKTSLI